MTTARAVPCVTGLQGQHGLICTRCQVARDVGHCRAASTTTRPRRSSSSGRRRGRRCGGHLFPDYCSYASITSRSMTSWSSRRAGTIRSAASVGASTSKQRPARLPRCITNTTSASINCDYAARLASRRPFWSSRWRTPCPRSASTYRNICHHVISRAGCGCRAV